MTTPLDAHPRLWRLARLGFDRVRQRPVLLYPEGAMILNDTGKAILELCDGARTVGDIAGLLGERYATDVSSDVIEYLDMLARRDLVILGAASGAPVSETTSHA